MAQHSRLNCHSKAAPNAKFKMRVETVDPLRTQIEALLARIASRKSTIASHPSEYMP